MTFQEEVLEYGLKELLPLLFAHRAEVNLFGEELDPDLETYVELHRNEMLKFYTMRDDSGIVGYSLYHIYNHLHHRKVKVAQADLIYVKPEHRLSGLKLLRYTEKALAREGVNIILTGAPEISRLGGVLEYKGYKVLEKMYIKEI